MGRHRRINVSSGRPLEHLAHYSRALRVGTTVLQSGTTAIDTEGNVIGVGDVAAQVDAIVDIAEASMGKAGGKLEDVVRSRVYVTDIALAEAAGEALRKHFRDARPATTIVAVNRLARPTQLIEIEFDAVDGAKGQAERFGSDEDTARGISHVVKMGDRIFIGGTTAHGGVADDMYTQTRDTWSAIEAAVEQAGASIADIVYTKTFITDLSAADQQVKARVEALGGTTPVETLLAVPALQHSPVEVEAEAIVGAAEHRHDIYTQNNREKPNGYARAVAVGDWVYVSGCTATDATGAVHDQGDWAAQYDYCHRNVEWALEQAGAKLDDVIRRRTFTVLEAEQNRPYGEGPGWFKDSRPVGLGCRIAGLAHPDMLVEVDAVAVKGAHQGIDWQSL